MLEEVVKAFPSVGDHIKLTLAQIIEAVHSTLRPCIRIPAEFPVSAFPCLPPFRLPLLIPLLFSLSLHPFSYAYPSHPFPSPYPHRLGSRAHAIESVDARSPWTPIVDAFAHDEGEKATAKHLATLTKVSFFSNPLCFVPLLLNHF